MYAYGMTLDISPVAQFVLQVDWVPDISSDRSMAAMSSVLQPFLDVSSYIVLSVPLFFNLPHKTDCMVVCTNRTIVTSNLNHPIIIVFGQQKRFMPCHRKYSQSEFRKAVIYSTIYNSTFPSCAAYLIPAQISKSSMHDMHSCNLCNKIKKKTSLKVFNAAVFTKRQGRLKAS